MIYVQLALLQHAFRDDGVGKAVFISHTSVPVKTLPEIHSDAMRSAHSIMCVDPEWARTEFWVVLNRRHTLIMTHYWKELVALFAGVGACDAEEYFYQALLLLGLEDEVEDRCVVFVSWPPNG